MTRKRLGVLALFVSTVVIFVLPAGSLAGSVDLREARDALVQAGQQVQAGLKDTVAKTGEKTTAVVEKTKSSIRQKMTTAKTRATATDPLKQPPLHGANPHGQGGVIVADLDPSNERPLDAKPDGSGSGEEVVVGRARGEQAADGTFHGHITILSLFGNELAGVDSAPGETKAGPLAALQTGILDPICRSTNQQICLSVLTANSKTTASGSTNDFAVARAKIADLGVGAAESNGTIAQDSTCQTSAGAAKTANVTAGGGAVASVANSGSTSKSCRGQAPEVTNTSQVIALGENGIPLPAPGCANGTPDTVTGLPGLLPIVCNADEIVSAAAVREALDVFVLSAGANSLAKETTASAESLSVAPAGETGPQCSDKVDNDGDGKIDGYDPGCHSDGKPDNPSSYNPSDNDESDKGGPTTGSGGKDDGGVKGGGEGGGGKGGGEGNEGSGAGGGPQCADGVDNDGDGVIDADDPGCHSDGNPNNTASYNDDDNSEGGAGAGNLKAGALPFTGTDVIGVALAGLLMLAGGLLLRRREGVRTVR
jgi:LPXTG-motif cell wall-anchored protein